MSSDEGAPGRLGYVGDDTRYPVIYRGSFHKLIIRIPSHGPGFDLCSDVFVF